MRILGILAVLVLSCSSLCAQNSSLDKALDVKAVTKDFNLIVPGVRIGPVGIGDSETKVIKAIGEPEQKLRYGRDITITNYANINENPEKPYSVFDYVEDRARIFYARGRVIQIDVSAKIYRTAEGLGPEDSIGKVLRSHTAMRRAAYGFGERGAFLTHIYDDVKRGIAFVVDSTTLTYDHSQETFWATVHQPGKQALPQKNVKPSEPSEPVVDDMFVDIGPEQGDRAVVHLKPGNGLPLVTSNEGNHKGKATSPIFDDYGGNVGVFIYVRTHDHNIRLKVPIVRMTLIRYSRKPVWKRLRRARLTFSGGHVYHYDIRPSSAIVSEGILRESVSFEMPYAKFVLLAKADEFEFGVGEEFRSFDKRQMAGIRALAKAVSVK